MPESAAVPLQRPNAGRSALIFQPIPKTAARVEKSALWGLAKKARVPAKSLAQPRTSLVAKAVQIPNAIPPIAGLAGRLVRLSNDVTEASASALRKTACAEACASIS